MPHTGDEKRGYLGDTPHTPDLLCRPCGRYELLIEAYYGIIINDG